MLPCQLAASDGRSQKAMSIRVKRLSDSLFMTERQHWQDRSIMALRQTAPAFVHVSKREGE